MTEQEFMGSNSLEIPSSGRVGWKAPSNIALIKYWGKKRGQIPTNPSLSFTLDACSTLTEIHFKNTGSGKDPEFEIFLDGVSVPDFAPKISQFLDRAIPYLPFLRGLQLRIETSNSFPHSSGIASSASGMAALALCLTDLERMADPGMTDALFHRKASFLARLGSGSAARSVEGGLIVWGNSPSVPGSSDLYAISYPHPVHPVFEGFHDTILLVDKGEKQVSSTVGHSLMDGHPFAAERFKQAKRHMDRIRPVFEGGDLEAFVELVESEALSLHAMMLSSTPSFILMKPGTLAILERIRRFREQYSIPVCFTLDAGANVHVLYPETEASEVYPFIQRELLEFCVDGHHICDRVGSGAVKIV
jgi:diphosphomevalonate decarboxylase